MVSIKAVIRAKLVSLDNLHARDALAGVSDEKKESLILQLLVENHLLLKKLVAMNECKEPLKAAHSDRLKG